MAMRTGILLAILGLAVLWAWMWQALPEQELLPLPTQASPVGRALPTRTPTMEPMMFIGTPLPSRTVNTNLFIMSICDNVLRRHKCNTSEPNVFPGGVDKTNVTWYYPNESNKGQIDPYWESTDRR